MPVVAAAAGALGAAALLGLEAEAQPAECTAGLSLQASVLGSPKDLGVITSPHLSQAICLAMHCCEGHRGGAMKQVRCHVFPGSEQSSRLALCVARYKQMHGS